MKNYTKEIVIGVLLLSTIAGFMLWFIKYEPDDYFKIGLISIVILGALFFYMRQLARKKRDVAAGFPAEDEFTNKAQLFAGSRAFLSSLYLWFFIFIFNSKFSDNEEMLGTGILGSILIYFACLWYYKTTGKFDEKQD